MNIIHCTNFKLVAGRFGDERNTAMTPKSAVCKPELQTVKIAATDDPSVLYIPSCTRIERCGGCCSHNLLSCQPVDIDTVSFQVVKTQFQGGSKLRFLGKEVVLIERHITCNCSCKVQPKDCNHFQKYNERECRCGCTNTDEEKKCQKEHNLKLWNPELCACQCKTMMQCSTGYTYDTFKCKCVPVLMRRRNAEIAVNKNERYEPLPVLPLYDNEEN
ncbi:hypothetical protein FQA39_LY09620 [Lamprigera yunnana]|nr:hypothetical protein FQA39_LY09620 [Lamprigera yunnana]